MNKELLKHLTDQLHYTNDWEHIGDTPAHGQNYYNATDDITIVIYASKCRVFPDRDGDLVEDKKKFKPNDPKNQYADYRSPVRFLSHRCFEIEIGYNLK